MRILTILMLTAALGAADLSVQLHKLFQAGSNDLIFAELTGACGGRDGSVFILDRRAGRVVRYGRDGRILQRFGRKGRGPGEFARPGSIASTADGRVVVCEERIFSSFFSLDGSFLQRVRVERGLGLQYLEDGLYYAWRWTPQGREQILVEPGGTVRRTFFSISRDAFSVSAPDETGRRVMSSYRSPLYTPKFLFTRCPDGAALARSDRYDIRLFDLKGDRVSRVTRRVDAPPLTAAERRREEEHIRASHSLHESIKKAFIRRIPSRRNVLAGLVLTPEYLLAVRPRRDPWREEGAVDVDVFTREGTFLGTVNLPGEPLWADGRRMLLREPGEEPVAGMYEYEIKLKS